MDMRDYSRGASRDSSGEANIFSNLFMVRHGESSCNTVNRIAGHLDAPLSALGRAQAGEVAKGLPGDARFDRVYVSPLSRAGETARIILDGNPSLRRAVTDARLTERDFGGYTMRNKSLLQKQHGVAEYERAMNHDSPTLRGGESAGDFYAKIEDFFTGTLMPALERGERVLVVSHKYVIETLCRLALGQPTDSAHDLRLPNSSMIVESEIKKYIRHENKFMNMLYDWITINYHLVFCAAIIVGVALNGLGVAVEYSPYAIMTFIIIATYITMSRSSIEETKDYLVARDVLVTSLARYFILPMALVGLTYVVWEEPPGLWLSLLFLMFAPSAIVSLTVARCSGGMIVPSLALVILSSLFCMPPLVLLFYLSHGHGAWTVIAVCGGVLALTVFAPYGLARLMRAARPVATAKFGERQGHLAVLSLALFILFVSMKIDVRDFVDYGVPAIALSLANRGFSWALLRGRSAHRSDLYISMTYPNVFIVVILAGILENRALEQMAIWFVIPMFALSFLDFAGLRRLAPAANDPALWRALKIPPKAPLNTSGGGAGRGPSSA